ncbi:MAG: tetratricopeptide repeat protein [Balneola sp.]
MIKSLLYITFLFLVIGSGDGKKGNEAYDKGNYAEADSLYRLALESEPEDSKLFFNLGNSLAKQGKVEDAIEAYLNSQEFAENEEDRALAQYNIGTLLAENEDWKPAAHHFRNSLKLNPNDTEAKQNYELAKKKTEDEESEQNQDQQNQDQEQEEPSEYAKAMKKRAEQLVAEERYKEALDLMNTALQNDKTVQNFGDFIERINTVNTINN